MKEAPVIDSFRNIDIWSEADYHYDVNTGRKVFKSAFPMWYYDNKLDQLKDEYNSLMARVNANPRDMGAIFVPEDSKRQSHIEAERLKIKIEQAEAMRPRFSDGFKDKLRGIRDEIGSMISDAMFSYTAQKAGFADPHKELKRQKVALIPITSGDIKLWLKACNLEDKLEGNGPFKASRGTLEIAWKIASKALDEESNVETLRPRDEPSIYDNVAG